MSRRRRALVAAALALSLIDAAFSLHQRGRFEEVNPLLRPLLATPGPFLVVKTACAIVGLIVLARLTRSRLAGALLVAAVVAYAVLDLYWIWRAAQ
jgi:hypothetical protein